MRKTKFICFLLSLVMVFCCFTTAFGASFTDVAVTAKHANAINTIQSLGIINGYTDGSFGADRNISRAEYAAIITRSLGYDFSINSATKFGDVPADYWASGNIALATNLGIIKGYSNGNFGPEDNITFAQAITMAVRALGYTDTYLKLANPNASYPLTQVVTALKLGLLEDLDYSDLNAFITRGEVAQLLYNALNVEIANFNVYGFNMATAGDTILARHTSKAVEGVITYTEKSRFNLIEEVGKYGYTYTDEKGYVIATVITSDQLTGCMKDGKFVVDDVKYTVTGTTAVAFTNAKEVGKVEVASLAAVYGTDEITLNCKVENGVITDVYSICRWVAQQEVQLTKSTVFNEKTFSLAGLKFANNGKELTPFSYVLNGAVELTDLVTGDVVTVYCYGGTGSIVRVDVCDDVVVGTVTKITSSPVTYFIDGVAYKSNVTLQLGFEYKCFLNAEGVITKATILKGINYATTQYGVINGAGSVLNSKNVPVNYFDGYINGEVVYMQQTSSASVVVPTAAGLYKMAFTDSVVDEFTFMTPTAITCSAIFTNLVKDTDSNYYVLNEDVVVYKETEVGTYTLGVVSEDDVLYIYDTTEVADHVYDVIIIKK